MDTEVFRVHPLRTMNVCTKLSERQADWHCHSRSNEACMAKSSHLLTYALLSLVSLVLVRKEELDLRCQFQFY